MSRGRRRHYVDWRNYISRKEDNPWLNVKKIDDYIGKGVFTRKVFEKGEFILEYAGELISRADGKKREERYPEHYGSFLYFFTFDGKKYCVDATFSKCKARYVNDSPHRTANATMKVKFHDSRPVLCLFAKTRIQRGKEIRYDYGVNNLPWRKKVQESSSQSDDEYATSVAATLPGTTADKSCSLEADDEDNQNKTPPDDPSMFCNANEISVRNVILKKCVGEIKRNKSQSSSSDLIKNQRRKTKKTILKRKVSIADDKNFKIKKAKCILDQLGRTIGEMESEEIHETGDEEAQSVTHGKSFEKTNVDDNVFTDDSLGRSMEGKETEQIIETGSERTADTTLSRSLEGEKGDDGLTHDPLGRSAEDIEIEDLSEITQGATYRRTLEKGDVGNNVFTQDQIGRSTEDIEDIETEDLSEMTHRATYSRTLEKGDLGESVFTEDQIGQSTDDTETENEDEICYDITKRAMHSRSLETRDGDHEFTLGQQLSANRTYDDKSRRIRGKWKQFYTKLKNTTEWYKESRKKSLNQNSNKDKDTETGSRSIESPEESMSSSTIDIILTQRDQSSEMNRSDKDTLQNKSEQCHSLTPRIEDKGQELEIETDQISLSEENEKLRDKSPVVKQLVKNNTTGMKPPIKVFTAAEVWARVRRNLDKSMSNKNSKGKTESKSNQVVANDNDDGEGQGFKEAAEKTSIFKEKNSSPSTNLNSSCQIDKRQTNASFAETIEISSEPNEDIENSQIMVNDSAADKSYQGDESESDKDLFKIDENWKHICMNRNTSQLRINSSSGDSSNGDLNNKDNENESSETKNKQKNLTSKKRKKMICYVCEKHIYHLLRHLRQVHGRDVQGRCANVKKSEAGYIYRICPVEDCRQPVARLRPHLREIHKKSSNEIKPLLIESEKVTEKHYREKKRKIQRNGEQFDSNDRTLCTGQHRETHKRGEKNSGNNSDMLSNDLDTDVLSSCQESNGIAKNNIDHHTICRSLKDAATNEKTPQLIRVPLRSTPDKTDFKSIPEIRQFISYLQGPGPFKSSRNSFQHGRQVFTIWLDVRTGSSFSSKDMLNINRIKSNWLTKHVTTWTPGTTKSYLGSLLLFLRFCINQDVEWKEKIPPAMEEIRGLSKDMRKKTFERRSVVESEDANSLIDAGMLQEFLHSDIVKQIENQLNSGQFRTLHRDVFIKIRNYLMLRILISNGQRPGALLGITPRVIRKATLANDGATLLVSKHKTAFMGPAAIGVPEPLWTWLNKYIRYLNFQPHYTQNRNDNDSIFVTYRNFEVLTSSLINKGIQKIWQEVMGKDTPITATKIRKSIVTNVRRICPSSRDSLASHMSHQATTADRYYNISSKVTNALSMSKFISSAMTRAGPLKIKWHESLADSKRTTYNQEDLNDAQNIDATSSADDEDSWDQNLSNKTNKATSSADDEDSWDQNLSNKTNKGNSTPDSEHSNSHLSSDENDNSHQFADENDVSRQSSEGNNESQITESDGDAWKVTSDCAENESSDCYNLTEKEEMYLRHGRRSFLPEDTAVLLALCRDLIVHGDIRQQNILLELSESMKGQQMIERFKRQFGEKYFLKKLYDRLRCERKKYLKDKSK